MCWNIFQEYLSVYHSKCLLYCLVSTINVTACTVLTLCDGQLAVPASNCTLCGYVLEYYSELSVCLSHSMFLILPLSSVHESASRVLTLCYRQFVVSASNCTL